MVTLDCSDSYREATEEVRNIVCNGCGPGSWKVDLIPDNLMGVSIAEACRIHDWDYALGQTGADKVAADKRFHKNMKKLIRNYSSCPVTRAIRYAQANGYFEAVSHGGHDAFWADKLAQV